MPNLPQYNNCVLDHRYFLGSFHDYSGNGNHGVPAGVCWEKRPDNHVRFKNNGDEVRVLDSSSLQTIEGTIAIYGDFDKNFSSERLFSKRDGLGCQVDFAFAAGATELYVFDGLVESSCTIDTTGKSFLCCSFASVGKPKFYVDGIYEGEGHLSLNVSVYGAPLTIGALSYSAAYNNKGSFKGVLFYNTVLTPSEISEVYEYYLGIFSPRLKKSNFHIPSLLTGREDGLVAAWDMENVGQKVVDKTSSSHDGAINGPIQVNPLVGKALLNTKTTDNVQIPHHTDLNITGAQSVSMLVKYTYNVGTQGLFVKGSNGQYIGISSGKVFWGSSAGFRYTTSSSNDGAWHHILLTYNGNSAFSGLKVYIDGSEPATAMGGTFSGFSTNTTNLTIGNRHTLNAASVGMEIADVRWYNRELFSAEIKNLYLQYAKIPVYLNDFSDSLESVSAVSGAGNNLENTNWKILSGSWKISRAEEISPNKKCIECATAGVLYTPSKHSYGTFEFSFYKGAEGNNPYITFMSDAVMAPGLSAGYSLQIALNEGIYFRRNVPGALPFNTAVSYIQNLTWYSIRITRRFDGQFSIYIKGGDWSNWTLIDVSGGSGTNPVSDNTHNTSKYLVLDLDAGDKVGDFKFYNGMLP